MACWQALTFMSMILQNSEPFRVYQEGNLSTFEVGGGEYLPLGSNTEDYIEALTYPAENIQVTAWKREGNRILVELKNISQDVCQVEVPLLYYKGYIAEDEAGNPMEIIPGKSGRISVAVPEGFEGSFSVEFREPWYWRITEVISLVMFLAVLYCGMRDFKKKRVNQL